MNIGKKLVKALQYLVNQIINFNKKVEIVSLDNMNSEITALWEKLRDECMKDCVDIQEECTKCNIKDPSDTLRELLGGSLNDVRIITELYKNQIEMFSVYALEKHYDPQSTSKYIKGANQAFDQNKLDIEKKLNKFYKDLIVHKGIALSTESFRMASCLILKKLIISNHELLAPISISQIKKYTPLDLRPINFTMPAIRNETYKKICDIRKVSVNSKIQGLLADFDSGKTKLEGDICQTLENIYKPIYREALLLSLNLNIAQKASGISEDLVEGACESASSVISTNHLELGKRLDTFRLDPNDNKEDIKKSIEEFGKDMADLIDGTYMNLLKQMNINGEKIPLDIRTETLPKGTPKTNNENRVKNRSTGLIRN
ncbi:MAG: hypothetical protein PHD60_09950 [Clostridia bacterium]|nr:hypothetical protein [Clostridia bacterium]